MITFVYKKNSLSLNREILTLIKSTLWLYDGYVQIKHLNLILTQVFNSLKIVLTMIIVCLYMENSTRVVERKLYTWFSLTSSLFSKNVFKYFAFCLEHVVVVFRVYFLIAYNDDYFLY